MRARVICVVTIFFAMVTATAMGNPILPVVPGPFVPGPGGEISFVADQYCSLSTVIIGEETLSVDTIIVRDSTVVDYWEWYEMPFVYKFDTDTLFPEEGSEFTIWFSDSSDMWFWEWPESFNMGLSPDFFTEEYYFSFWTLNRIPIATDGYYWRMVYLYYLTDGDYWQYQLKPLPVDYNLPLFASERFSFDDYIRINEVKAFGTDRFVEIAKFSEDTLTLDGWRLLGDGGLHNFSIGDTLIDYFALFESDWDSGFELLDTCQLLLISPEGNLWSNFAWKPWAISDYSVNVYIDPDTFWRDTIAYATPTPGAMNAMGVSEKASLPSTVAILSAQPNPFNASAIIGYEFAPGVSSATMDIFDINGRLIRSRDLTDTRSGYHETKIAALPSSGTYLVRIETNRGSAEGKITYLK